MVGFMSYYDIPNEGYLPCELGAVEYSLNGGILRRLHFFLPPGYLPLLLLLLFYKTQGFPQKSSQVSVRMMMMTIMMMMIFSNYCLSVPIDFQGFFSLYKQISLAFFLLKP